MRRKSADQAALPSSSEVTPDSTCTPESTTTLCDFTSNAFTPGQHIEVATRDALPFRHVKFIGQGGSAVIEMVSHKSTNEVFALKTFRRFYGGRFEKVKRAFQNEVSIMQRLSSHAHIIQIAGTYTCDHELGMILSPAANEGDLAAYIAKAFEAGMTREQEVVLNRAFGCLASGLAYIHEHTIRHKDIKPQNILIHDGRVIYTDFGIAFDADQQDTTTVGYPGAFTRRYCAPEVQDHANRNRKSDVYSLGCVFVEILDVLEPKIGFRDMDNLPYFQKSDPVRAKLVHTKGVTKARKGLLRICYDMLEPDQVFRIDTGTVLSRIAKLHGPKDRTETKFSCNDCWTPVGSNDTTVQEELVDDFTVVSLNASSNIDVESTQVETQPTAKKASKKSKKKDSEKKKNASSIDIGKKALATVATTAISSQISRYYCTACGELGHTSSNCTNKCWDCDEVGHYARDCPNKCWTCDEVGHQAKDCPDGSNARSARDRLGDEFLGRCYTCGEVGHLARDCQDECFICGRLGHGTKKCWGKCHKCGMIGHWKRECADACGECGKYGHGGAQCPNKKKKGRRGDLCFECGESGHWASQCPDKKRGWRPIFEQVPQGPYKPKPRRQN